MTGREGLAAAFRRCAEEGRAALIPFLAAGDPDFDTTIELARAAADGGADVLELGIPFGDSLADGPVIQAAYVRALASGATVAGALDCAARVVEATGLPVVLMSALNLLLSHGIEAFCRDAAAAGAAALLVPDLPVEDAEELSSACRKAGLATVYLVAPDSASERVDMAARASTGFVYLVRRRGVTGVRGENEGRDALARARRSASVPVALGFGITTPQEAAQAARSADGVIVGSAVVRAAAEAVAASDRPPAEAVRHLLAGLASAVRTAADPNGGTPAEPGVRP